ncbi:MAG: ABC transporter substrate-binding protein [[Clostridium] leptum]
MKKVLALLLSGALLLSAAACSASPGGESSAGADSSSTAEESAAGASEKTSSTDGQQLQTITFVLDWTPNTNHTGIYVADKLGYFKEAGIQIDIQQPPEDGATALVATGKAQFGVDFQDYLAPAYVSDLPVTAVAALIQHNTSGIISLKEKGINLLRIWRQNLRHLGSAGGTGHHAKRGGENDGGDWSKVNLASVTVTDVISALQTNIDAVWIYYAWDGIATQVKGLDTNYFYFKDINPVFDYYTPVLVANNDYLEQNPETAKAFLAAVAKGYEYAIENPEEAAEILCEADPTLDSEIVLSSQQWLADQYKAEVDRWGYIDPSRWDAFYQWLWENQLIEEEIPAGFGFSNDYLPE